VVITEFVFAVAVTLALFVILASIPVLAQIGTVVTPLPVLYFYCRMGRFRGLLYYVLTLFLVFWFLTSFEAPVATSYYFILSSLGLILSEVLRLDLSIEKTVLITSAGLLILVVAVLSWHGVSSGRGLSFLVEENVARIVRENIELYAGTGAPAAHVEMIRSKEARITAVLLGVIPSLVITGCAVVSWVSLLAGSILFRKRNMWYPDFGDLTRWKLPDGIVWVAVITFAVALIPWKATLLIGMNGLIIMLFLFMLQGFAVISCFFKVKQVPLFIRIALYLMILIQPLLFLPVAVLGIIDMWADFRKPAFSSPDFPEDT
jgi:uncharacterized protein YybS (DUF2232 family)